MDTAEDDRIRAFWIWFTAHHAEVLAAYQDEDGNRLDSLLTPAVKVIEPRLNWELGPYHHPANTLVISPAVRENLALAERIVAAAPPVPGWHFLPAKPPKDLKRLVMLLPGVDGAKVEADDWVYRLTAYNRMEFFDLDVYTDDAGPIADDDLEQLTHHLIESLVGERYYLELIAAVHVWRYPEDRPTEKLTRLPLLGRHLAYLLKQPRQGPPPGGKYFAGLTGSQGLP